MSAVIQVAVAAIVNDRDEVLIARRPAGVHQGGLWEFPGGKMEDGESLMHALARELEEELGIEPLRVSPLITISHDYGDKRVCLRVCRVEAFTGEPRGREGQPLRWVPVASLNGLTFPAANRPIIRALQLPDQYLITPDPFDEQDAFLERLQRRLEQGDIRLMQLRAPSLDADALERLAARAASLAHSLGVRILINADHDLAMSAGADGVHLNAYRLARWRGADSGREWMVAASVHDARELAMARDAGVDFAVIAPVQATISHPGVPGMGWSGFRELAAVASMPVYALGGLRPDDAAHARRCGGQGVAGISGFWSTDERGS